MTYVEQIKDLNVSLERVSDFAVYGYNSFSEGGGKEEKLRPHFAHIKVTTQVKHSLKRVESTCRHP